MICNTLKNLEDEDERKIDWTTIKKFLRILCVILIIYTTLYITFFKCFLVLNDSITRAPQTVTLSSEGPANEMYPDSMGEYQLAEEVIQGWDADYTWYRHKDREDRFLMYNNLGNIETHLILILSIRLGIVLVVARSVTQSVSQSVQSQLAGELR